MRKTLSELSTLRERLANGQSFLMAGVNPAVVINLLDQAIADQKAVADLTEFMGLMARKGSSWRPQIEKKLNEYLFNGASPEAIEAAKALLEKHRNVTVDNLLRTLEEKTKPQATVNTTIDPNWLKHS